MNYFTFDGIDSRTYNTYIATSNAFDAPGREDEVIKVPGSNNIYYLTEGTYKPFDIKLYCYIPSNMQVKTDDLRNFLLSKGTCRYTEAIRPNEFRVARFIEAYELDVSDRVSAAFVLTFKAQPQRYLTTNTPITTTATADTTTDTTMSLSTVPTPLNISLNGNTTQEGSSGKNIFDFTYWANNINTSTLTKTVSGNSITLTALRNDAYTPYNNSALFPKVTANTSYTFSWNVVSYTSQGEIYIFAENDAVITHIPAINNHYVTFNSGSNTVIKFRLGVMNNGGTITFTDMQFEKGSTATAYEPHISPTNPQPIHNVSGDNEVKVIGKNVFDYLAWANGTAGIRATTSVSGNNFTITATGNDAYTQYEGTYDTLFPRVMANTTYTFSWKVVSNTGLGEIYIFSESGSVITHIPAINNHYVTFNSGNSTYIKFRLGVINSGTSITFTDLQFEKGSVRTDYEPYTRQSYPLNLGSIELNKIGTRQDYIYKNGGKWYLYKEFNKVDLGTLTWEKQVSSSIDVGYYFQTQQVTLVPSTTRWLCTSYPNTGYTGLSNIVANLGRGVDKIGFSAGGTLFYIIDSGYTEATAFKTSVSGKYLIYSTNTPTNTEITDTTLINQLNNIEKAYSYNGTTNILQVSNDNGFMLEVVSLHSNDVSSDYKGEPIITVNSTGLIYFNGCVIKVNQAPMTINSQTMQAYNGVVNLNNYIEANDFPMIEAGTNVIGSEMPLSIVPNYWKL